MNRFNFLLLAGLFLGLAMIGCSKDDDNNSPDPEPVGNAKYVLAVTTTAGGATTYLLTADNLSKGTTTTTGNGTETDDYGYIVQNNTLFGQVYGFSNQGPVTSFNLNNQGHIVKGTTLNIMTTHAMTTVNNNDILFANIPRDINSPTATFTIVNAINPQIKSSGSVNLKTVANNGELAYFTHLVQIGNKIYAPFMSIKGTTDNAFGSNYLDNSWVAVFSYPSMLLDKVFKDNRTSYIGSYSGMNALNKIDNGEVYAFSTAITGSTRHSAGLRINTSSREFDQSYFFDIETASGGHKYARSTYVGGTRFLAEMYTEAGASTGTVKLAILDVASKTVTWVANSPIYTPSLFSTPTYVESDKNTVNIPIKDATGQIAIYQVNASNATITKGLVVNGAADVYAINKLTY